MFKRRPKTNDEMSATDVTPRKKINWFKVSIFGYIVILVVVLIGAASAVVIHASNTDPNFCGSCHVMQSHVTSYSNSGNLDNFHAQAGVLCKDCHDYPLSAEITGGVNYLTSNYVTDENGELLRRDFGNEICTRCHISMEHVAVSTDFLYRNPHDAADMGAYTCNQCHLSHAAQIDFCSECHDNGGQRMLGDATPREELLGESSAPPPSPW